MKKLIQLAAFLFLFSACATIPPSRSSYEWLSLLPPESTFFASIKIEPTEDLLLDTLVQANLNSKEFEKIISRTDRILAGVHISPIAPPTFALISLGDYPFSMVKFPLCTSKDWKRVKSGVTFWQHVDEELQIGIPERNVILISNGIMDRMLSRFGKPEHIHFEDEVVREMDEVDLMLYFPSLPTTSNTSMIKLPIRSVRIILENSGQAYEAAAVFTLTEEKSASALQMLFRLVITMWMRQAEMEDLSNKMKDLEISVIERSVRISGLSFSKEEIIRAVSLLLGSEQT